MKTPEEELIERYVEAFNRHDIDDVMEFADGKIKEIRDYHQLASTSSEQFPATSIQVFT